MNLHSNIDAKKLSISRDAAEAGERAGIKASELIQSCIRHKGQANIILATGASQFSTLGTLVNQPIDWDKVVMFHLDEYIGLPATSPASFRKYLTERFISRVSTLKAVHLINGEADPQEECARLSDIIKKHPIDVALVGIGENGHLAFNDPPADFATELPYLVVSLDDICRRQQMGEGWFSSLEEVPATAISMSVRQICLSQNIICTVPDSRKAEAVKNSLEGPVTPMVPASILQQHSDCWFYLDHASAALLTR
jgi:glucosamine-6-phosphate deaminase